MHTLEPWRVEKQHYDSSSFYIRGTKKDGTPMTFGLGAVAHIPRSTVLPSEDNARRIVACVNACAGISTSLIEKMGAAGDIFELSKLCIAKKRNKK